MSDKEKMEELKSLELEEQNADFTYIEYIDTVKNPLCSSAIFEYLALLIFFVTVIWMFPGTIDTERTSVPINFNGNVTANFEHEVSLESILPREITILCALKQKYSEIRKQPFFINTKSIVTSYNGEINVKTNALTEYFNSTEPIQIESFSLPKSSDIIRFQLSLTGNLTGYSSLDIITCLVSARGDEFIKRTRYSVSLLVLLAAASILCTENCKKNLPSLSVIIVSALFCLHQWRGSHLPLLNAMRFFMQIHLQNVSDNLRRMARLLIISVMMCAAEFMALRDPRAVVALKACYFAWGVYQWSRRFKGRDDYNTQRYMCILFGISVIGLSPIICYFLPLCSVRRVMIELACLGFTSVLMLNCLRLTRTRTKYQKMEWETQENDDTIDE